MIRHIVWWTLKEHANGRTRDENAMHILKSSAMLHGLPSLRSIEVSSKVEGSTTVPAHVVLTTTHDNIEDLQAYANDPVHLEFAGMVKELVSSRNAIDFTFE